MHFFKKLIKIGKFLCSQFTIEDGRKYTTFSAYYALLFQKGKNATEVQKKICDVYGEAAVTDQMCQKWFVKFHAGDFSLDDAPGLGTLVEIDSDQIETLIENNQCYTMWEITDMLKISISIMLLVKMKTVFFILQKKTKRTF